MESIRSDSARNNLRKTSGPPEPAPLCKYLFFFQNHNDACTYVIGSAKNLVKPKHIIIFENIYEKRDFIRPTCFLILDFFKLSFPKNYKISLIFWHD